MSAKRKLRSVDLQENVDFKYIVNDKDTLKLELKVVLTIIVMIAGVIAAHFYGLSDAKHYTDTRIKERKVETDKQFDRVIDKLDFMHKDLTSLKIKGANQ